MGVITGSRSCETYWPGWVTGPVCYWPFLASAEAEWDAEFVRFRDQFQAWTADLELICTVATLEQFADDVAAADAVYLHGGSDDLVQRRLREFDLPALWAGKTVATNSASSHALSQHYWKAERRRCEDGLGLLPMKYLAHYDSSWGADDPRGPIDWPAARSELEAYGPDLPVHALREGEWVTYEG